MVIDNPFSDLDMVREKIIYKIEITAVTGDCCSVYYDELPSLETLVSDLRSQTEQVHFYRRLAYVISRTGLSTVKDMDEKTGGLKCSPSGMVWVSKLGLVMNRPAVPDDLESL